MNDEQIFEILVKQGMTGIEARCEIVHYNRVAQESAEDALFATNCEAC